MENRSLLEIKKNERSYQLILDPTSPLGEVFDVVCEFQFYVLELMKTTHEKLKNSVSEEKSAEG